MNLWMLTDGGWSSRLTLGIGRIAHWTIFSPSYCGPFVFQPFNPMLARKHGREHDKYDFKMKNSNPEDWIYFQPSSCDHPSFYILFSDEVGHKKLIDLRQSSLLGSQRQLSSSVHTRYDVTGDRWPLPPPTETMARNCRHLPNESRIAVFRGEY